MTSVYEGLECPYLGVSLAQNLASELQIKSSPLVGPVIRPPGHFLRVCFTLEVVVEKLGWHPFEHFHQSIALQPFLPSTTIPPLEPGNGRDDRFKAQSIHIVSAHSNPEPKVYMHTVCYSLQHRNSRSRRRMHFTWLSSGSSHLWQFVPDVEPILRDDLAMRWMLGLPDFGGESHEDALLHVPALFNRRNKELADEMCRQLGVKLPLAPDDSKVRKAIDRAPVPNLWDADYARFDPFQVYHHLHVK